NKNKIIALVEDEELIRDLYKRQFENAGFATVVFKCGQDALDWFEHNTVDLVLLDIMLPDINGIEILRRLKGNEPTKTMRIVLLTNLGQDEIFKEAQRLGAEGHLIKASYTPAEIVKIVQKKLL
ncbi:MAG: response regulator, partial [Candidatus Roizmanbacteria bacterium]|nr:response regulator [Candidatus Roizmanbacteria bacterium]